MASPAASAPSADGPAANSAGSDASRDVLEQPVLGSRRLSNLLVAAAVSLGGVGFLLTSASSRFGRNFLPIGHPAELTWVPQGLVMGLYGLAAVLLATYLWTVIGLDVGSGTNRFDRASGQAVISRRGFRRRIEVSVPLRDIQAVKVEIREGLSPRRRLALRIQGRRELPLSRVGEPIPLAELELAGARLARFLGVPLEGL
ncbi:MAG: photosystem I assembly protein Ycf4 [Synechococcaceae cyanobacterium]|nr:photosystem I assembly protein Ycf4 [Synechococcaceae cyanobacterium]